jgi:hypothetical protein
MDSDNPNSYPPLIDPSPFTLATASTPQNVALPENVNPPENDSADSFVYFDQDRQVQSFQSRSVSSAQSMPVADAAYNNSLPVAGTDSMQQLVRYGYNLRNIQY